MMTLDDFSLFNITPENIANDKNISSIIQALDPVFRKLARDSLIPALISNIDILNDDALAFLAAQFHSDNFALASTTEQKREAVKNSLILHMKKGTAWAIIEGLRQIGVNAQFLHWHDFNFPPYTFRIIADINEDTFNAIHQMGISDTIRTVIEQNKSARSLMLDLDTTIHEHDNFSLYQAVIDFLSGHSLIQYNRPSSPAKSIFYFAQANALQGSRIIANERDTQLITNYSPCIITTEYRNLEIGADLPLMYELLAQFEKRILDALRTHEMNINAKINDTNSYMSSRFNEIEELLQWKDE